MRCGVRWRCSETHERRHPDVRGVRVSRGGRGREQEAVTGRHQRARRVAATDAERDVRRHRRPCIEAESQNVPTHAGGRLREGSDLRFGG